MQKQTGQTKQIYNTTPLSSYFYIEFLLNPSLTNMYHVCMKIIINKKILLPKKLCSFDMFITARYIHAGSGYNINA